MTGALALLEHASLVALGWLVILSSFASTLPALALAGWRLLRPAAPAPRQHRAAAVAFAAAAVLALVAVPLLLVVPASSGAPDAPGVSTSTAPRAPAARDAATAPVAAPLSAVPPRPAPSASALLLPAVLGLVAIAWGTGATLMLGRLVVALGAASRLRQRATLVDPSPLRDTFERLCAEVHLGGTVLAVSTEVDAPVTVGARSPAVLVPAHLLDVMPEEGLAPVLAHELAHVTRRDYAINLAQSACEAVLFHCPAIWWMGARIREAREFCCDDASVDVAGDRARYVEALTLVARLGTVQHARPAVGMAGPRLITRVRRLLEGEPTMSMPIVRASLVAVTLIVVGAALPRMFATASAHLSTQLLAAGQATEAGPVPYGFPQRQEGSALRILRVSSTPEHVCGAFDVQNVGSVAVARLRLVGVVSFRGDAVRPVLIRESEWLTRDIAPGATALVQVPLVERAEARREARGEHVQAYCAVREVVHANQVTWAVTPNPAATTDIDALGLGRWPTLPRAFVGQSHAAAFPRATLCLDEKGAEYSGGAQVAIRDEPGKAARCTKEGQWVEVDARSGEALSQGEQVVVAFDVAVDGLPRAIALKSAAGQVATLRLADGSTWGLVPVVAANGDVALSLHDMSSTPHRLLATRLLQPGANTRFEEASPALNVRVAQD